MKNVNVRVLIAKREIREAFGWIVGGEENTLLDYSENSEEYREAKAFLSDRTAIMNAVYDSVINGAEKDIRFLGSKKIMELINALVVKEGY